MFFNGSTLLLIVLVPLLGFFVGKWLYTKDTEKEQRRLACADLAGELQGLGLVWIPKLLRAYAVGDYSGMVKMLADVIRLFMVTPKAVLDEFDKIFQRVLVKKVSTPEGRAYVEAMLDDARDVDLD